MNIILLSGGSGKRLWPLSNDVRSKQFIKIFYQDGKYESMVQRVFRQINLVDAEANITITTSKSQVSAIKNQLNQQVSICAEPQRRDTFPAMLLATTYLHYELGISKDEPVIICPIDSFVENSYYYALKEVEQLVKAETAKLTLMGIEPTYPSEKYGYILPKNAEKVSQVEAFYEKPDQYLAEKYLKNDALWNAGVFAFKLGYLLDKAHQTIDFIDYHDLYNQYHLLQKVSFDYAVVEKETSIQVMRYQGQWKDIGTWNTMAETMTENIKGSAVIDDTSFNTHIVNELNVPIIAMGCKNLIIAASNDGILVADKEQSSYMKPYVEKVERDTMFAEKSWGTYAIIDICENCMTVKVSIIQGHQLTYHSHEHRREIWTILQGQGIVTIDDVDKVLYAGDNVTIEAGCKHKIKAITNLVLLEVQQGDKIDVEDKAKYV